MVTAVTTTRRLFRVLQTVWSILGLTLLAILLMEAGFRLVFAIKDRLSSTTSPDPRVIEAAYHGEAWIARHYRELEMLQDRWEPYVYFRQRPLVGETIRVDEAGRRRTWQPPPPARGRREPFKILMLGGSSLWGFGSRDDRTIPSLVARKLNERGVRVEVRNLAEIGYVSTQEVVALVRELQSGYRPDLVVFYDGVNDAASALLEGEAGVTTNERNRRAEFNLRSSPARLIAALVGRIIQESASYRFARVIGHRLSLMRGTSSGLPPADVRRSLAAEVVRRYEANIQIVDRLGRGFGFVPLFFWQPVVFEKPYLTPYEQDEARKWSWASDFFTSVYHQVRESIELRAVPSFHDLSRAFDPAAELIFVDYCHVTESGNERLAEAMIGPIEAALNARNSR